MSSYFFSLVNQSLIRSTEATLSVLGITNPYLREHLTKLMSASCGQKGSLLAPPVFEHTFGWEVSNYTMDELASKNSILSQAIVNSLDNKMHKRYRFAADWKPFKHQLACWQALLKRKHSVVVTSGTGSGKTECFMVPVLEDLYREYKVNNYKPLIGVRALFLYPLNALINSQRERLNAWTQEFGMGIRYCLYNGNTIEEAGKIRSEQKNRPNEVLSRELLRENPAPILVTNGTMLEYMMIRQVDAPIIKKSRDIKSLRWIVLDEAHTYIGSQAAELALQLRRVMHFFGVTPSDIRFIATSATIAGKEAEQELKRFLSNLSGVSIEQIEVIGGNRIIPDLPISQSKSISLSSIEGKLTEKEDSEVSKQIFDILVHSLEARTLRHILVSNVKPLSISQLGNELNKKLRCKLSQNDILRWIDICSIARPAPNEPAFLKLRGHFFQKMIQGLWTCFNKNCSAKRGTPLEHNWPFGYVYVEQQQKCSCGSPIFELVFCNECNEPHLMVRDKQGKLVQWELSISDEFSLQLELDDEDEEVIEPLSASKKVAFLSSQISEDYIETQLDEKTGEFKYSAGIIKLGLNPDTEACSRCGFKGYSHRSPFRRALLGAPFYVANVVPTVLEHCPDFNDKEANPEYGPQSLPGRGRRLITFTDSRQGTARMSIRMQQEAERSRLRGLVFEILKQYQNSQSNVSNNDRPLSKQQINKLIAHEKENIKFYRSLGMLDSVKESESKVNHFAKLLEEQNDEIDILSFTPMNWIDLVNELKQKSDLYGAMLPYNKYLKPEIFGEYDGAFKLGEMLLAREFMRRPKRQNNLETQGLVKVVYQDLDKVKLIPEYWERNGLSLEEWKDFLKVALDFYVRENSFIQLNDDWKNWIGSRFSPKTLRNPESKEPDDYRVKHWPQINKIGRYNRLAKLLLLGAKLNPANKEDIDLVNYWLKSAWKDLTSNTHILSADGNRFYLDRKKLSFSFLNSAFICPITHKLLDTTFKQITPYLPTYIDFKKMQAEQSPSFDCSKVLLPNICKFDRSQDDYQKGIEKIRKQVGTDQKICYLRSQNLWTDINDRTIEGGFYYRTAEHSAQQSAQRLQDYEEKFKKGSINVLNCSTTMEMGVDIGGVSAVVMNNVPPHPSNYLQRAGRAGRSQESRALAYTLCKSNPHDMQVFNKPTWPFDTIIPTPIVTFNSERVVQRHINSLLLAEFLCNEIGVIQTEKIFLNSYWFFNDETKSSICNEFIASIDNQKIKIDFAINMLVKGTCLEGKSIKTLYSKTKEKIIELRDKWLGEYQRLLELEHENGRKSNTPYGIKIKIEKQRLCDEYLLRDLAANNFLPGYGFPTDVVNFDNFTKEDFVRNKVDKDREDNVARFKGLPSRNLAVAIREYAPGSEVVIDGRVFRSVGVSLNWHNLNSDKNEPQRVDKIWRCHMCGQLGYEKGTVNVDTIYCSNSSCNTEIKIELIKYVLQPTGFVTDVNIPTTNNIQQQKFIPIESAWVFANTKPEPLFNKNLGYMAYNNDGNVFHHSSGEFGFGYALCFSCGRAESMTKSNDYPQTLLPDGKHYSPRPRKEDKGINNHSIPCQGSGNIKQNINLGALVCTDVFELILQHPKRREYIKDNEEGRKIAMTLAVALRLTLANILGISASELGYAIRPTRLEGNVKALVIQLYDVISGGGGFATTAPKYIEQLLKEMLKRLDCDHCETACNECLLDSETRYSYDLLDQSLTLNWLGNDFISHL